MAKRKKVEKVDGLGPDDLRKLRTAIRQVWQWSRARNLCLKRAIGKDGFPRCEKCKKRAPKVYPDHIVPAGVIDAGFIQRMFCPSSGLQALCKKCHDPKTRAERKALAAAKEPLLIQPMVGTGRTGGMETLDDVGEFI